MLVGDIPISSTTQSNNYQYIYIRPGCFLRSLTIHNFNQHMIVFVHSDPELCDFEQFYLELNL